MDSNKRVKKTNSKIASELLDKIKSSEESIDWLKGYQERLILTLFNNTVSASNKETVKRDILGINDDISTLKDHIKDLEEKLMVITEE